MVLTNKLNLLYRHRKQWKQTKGGCDHVHEYEMVSDLQKNDKKQLKTKPTIEIVPNPPESDASLLTVKPTIDDIDDHSENESNTMLKSSVKNILYETG